MHGGHAFSLPAAGRNVNPYLSAYGNAPLFDQIFNGYNLGLGAVNGSTVTGSASLRQYSTTRTWFATNAVGSFANWLNTTNAFSGVNGGLLSHGGLPQNFVVVNPQYASISTVCACANASYDSGIVELRKSYSHGLTFQTNVTWAKSIIQGGGGDGSNSYRNPRNWSLDRALAPFNVKWAWKGTGTYMLPFGPGQPFLHAKTGAEGVFGKILEQWQLGTVLTVYSGNPLQLSTGISPFTNTGTNTATQVGQVPSGLGKVIRVGNGVTYFPDLTQVTDPTCNTLTAQQSLSSACTLKALAYNGNVVLQNSAPGVLGTTALYSNLTGPGLFDLDLNLLKRFSVKERVSVEFRVDAIAVTNTPHFANPTTSINSTSFGRITAPSTNGANAFTTPPPYNGNRTFVANLRISF